MKQYNRKKGVRGEEIAERYLVEKGFLIIEKNFSTRFGEIDIVAAKNPSANSGQATLHFVEVKLKVGERFGTPEEMISKRKIWQVMRTAESFLLKNKEIGEQFLVSQIDAVCIVLNEEGAPERVDYYEDLSSEL